MKIPLDITTPHVVLKHIVMMYDDEAPPDGGGFESTGKNYEDLSDPNVADFIANHIITPALANDYSELVSEIINRAVRYPFLPISSNVAVDIDGYGTLMITTTVTVVPEARMRRGE